MLRFALLPVPQALAHVAPTLTEYEASIGTALSLDGEVYASTATGLLAPLAGPMLVVPRPRQAPPFSQLGASPLSLATAAKAIVEECIRSVDAATPQLGTNARETLRAKLRAIGRWVLEHHDSSRSLGRFANSQLYRVRREFLRRYGARRLWLELRDERQREAALWHPGVREAYLVWWQRRIAALQRKLSWRVPGLSGHDLAGELLVLLIEAVDSGDDTPFVLGGAPGIEGTFSFLVRKKNWLRRRRQIREVVLHEGVSALHDRTPSGEDLVIAKEQRTQAQSVMDRAAERLSARQQRYFHAVLEDVREHGFLSEVRIAEQLGLHKSSISRAVKIILATLRKTGAADVLEGLRLGGPRAKRRRWWIDGQRERPRSLLLAAPSEPPVSPQPPWLDVGDCVTLKTTGEHGVIVGVDHSMIGALYRVRCGTAERGELVREALEYRSPISLPF
jgi:hypothetical protein